MLSSNPILPRHLARRLTLAFGAFGLVAVSLPSHAIVNCPNPPSVSMLQEIKGTPLTAESKAGDVLLTRVYRISQPYTVTNSSNQNRMRLGAGWTSQPVPPYQTISAGSGLGVRWRHLDSGGGVGSGTIIYGGNNHANTFSQPDQQPTVSGSYEMNRFFVQEFVLLDPALFVGGKLHNYYTSSAFSIFAHGLDTANPTGTLSNCNAGAEGVGYTNPKLIHVFLQTNLTVDAPPPPLNPTCTVSTASRNMTVNMHALGFPDTNNTASSNWVPVAINLENCAINARPSANFTDNNNTGNASNLLTLKNGAGSTSNVPSLGGILLRHNGRDVVYGPETESIVPRSVAVGTATSGNPNLRLDLNAHLYRKAAGSITAGTFDAAATFILSYP